MREPVVTMSRSDNAPRALRGLPQCDAGARRDGANTFLDQGPRGFNRIEVLRVGRQEPQRRPDALDQIADGARLMRGQIVHHDYIAAAQVPHQVATDPRHEPRLVQGAPRRRQRHPAVNANRADHREVRAPIHRPRFHQHGPAGQPRVRASHREIRAGFIEKHQAARVYPPDPALECTAFGLDRGPIQFRWARSFFLNTYPLRCKARNTLDRWTRASGAARRLYARVNSSVVRSGRSWTSEWSNGTSTGEYQPPPFGAG